MTTKPPANKFDMNAALQQYGVLGQIVAGIPELKAVLEASAKAGDSPDAFNAKIAASPWYRQHGDGLRNYLLQQASDPATLQNNLANQVAAIQAQAGTMGRWVTAGQAANIAKVSLQRGWTQQQVNTAIASAHVALEGPGVAAGEAGKLGEALRQSAAQMGVPYTDAFIASYVQKIQKGQDTQDGFDNLMKARAKAAYPQFAAQIDQGLSMKDVADPYAAQMAKTLELPQTAVKWQTDPLIQRALTAKDPTTGQPTGQPLWQFNQALMKDPRYDHTMQAKTDAYSVVSEIGKSWGFYA